MSNSCHRVFTTGVVGPSLTVTDRVHGILAVNRIVVLAILAAALLQGACDGSRSSSSSCDRAIQHVASMEHDALARDHRLDSVPQIRASLAASQAAKSD